MSGYLDVIKVKQLILVAGTKKMILKVREAYECQKCSFFNIVQTAFDPPLVLNMYVANFFEQLLKKCANVSATKFDKIMRKSVGKCQTYPKI